MPHLLLLMVLGARMLWTSATPQQFSSFNDGGSHSNIFARHHSIDELHQHNNIFSRKATPPSRRNPTATPPTLTFVVRIGLPESQSTRGPSPSDRLSLLCQLNRYIQQRLRDQTGDTDIRGNLHDLDWTYSSSAWQLRFVVHSTFGSGKRISPWTLVKVLELSQDNVRYLVRNYLWPLQTTIFASTRTLLFGGTLEIPSEEKARGIQMSEVPLENCPIAPPLPPPPTPSPTSTSTRTDPFGAQSEVPLEDPFLALPKTEQLPALTHPQPLTITVDFWVANDRGIQDASSIRSQWIDPTFPALVERVVAAQPEPKSPTSRVIPNSTRVVAVHPLPCPVPVAMPVDWNCHSVRASYDLQPGDLLAIPLAIDPAVHTRATRDAIRSGLYQSMMHQQLPSLPAIRIGNDVEALQYSWWHSNASRIDVVQPDHSSIPLDQNEFLRIGLLCLCAAFFVLLVGLVLMERYCQRKLRILQRQRQKNLGGLQALLSDKAEVQPMPP